MTKPNKPMSGAGAFMKFNRGMLKFPIHWKLFLVPMVVVNAVAPLFFLQHVEAQIVLGAFLVSFVIMVYLTGRFGFTRILGLGHILWIPMLIFLVPALGNVPSSDAFGIWIRILFVINVSSLAIDAADVTRFIAGDRAETIPGL